MPKSASEDGGDDVMDRDDILERGARSETNVEAFRGEDFHVPLLVSAHEINHDTESEVEVAKAPDDNGNVGK